MRRRNSTLDELISSYPAARFKLEEIRSAMNRLTDVIAEGEILLILALNLSRGGNWWAGNMKKDEKATGGFW